MARGRKSPAWEDLMQIDREAAMELSRRHGGSRMTIPLYGEIDDEAIREINSAIRADWAKGMSIGQLTKKYNRGRQTINNILNAAQSE